LRCDTAGIKSSVDKREAQQDDDMRPEYDFSGGVRKHHKAYREGHIVKIHQEDGTVLVQEIMKAIDWYKVFQ
jgi:hypothetical protein